MTFLFDDLSNILPENDQLISQSCHRLWRLRKRMVLEMWLATSKGRQKGVLVQLQLWPSTVWIDFTMIFKTSVIEVIIPTASWTTTVVGYQVCVCVSFRYFERMIIVFSIGLLADHGISDIPNLDIRDASYLGSRESIGTWWFTQQKKGDLMVFGADSC